MRFYVEQNDKRFCSDVDKLFFGRLESVNLKQFDVWLSICYKNQILYQIAFLERIIQIISHFLSVGEKETLGSKSGLTRRMKLSLPVFYYLTLILTI